MKPLPFICDGETLRPHPSVRAAFVELYVPGRTYRMAPTEERSQEEHNRYFACIKEAWDQLEHFEHRQFPTSEVLRKTALVETGYHTTTPHWFETAADAVAFRDAYRARGLKSKRVGSKHTFPHFVVVDVKRVKKGRRPWLVLVHEPTSQQWENQSHHEFNRCQEAVLQWCADKLKIKVSDLKDNAGRAA